jgi:hypothetical protein
MDLNLRFSSFLCRLPGFQLCVQALQGFLALAIVGVTHNVLLLYLGINLKGILLG